MRTDAGSGEKIGGEFVLKDFLGEFRVKKKLIIIIGIPATSHRFGNLRREGIRPQAKGL